MRLGQTVSSRLGRPARSLRLSLLLSLAWSTLFSCQLSGQQKTARNPLLTDTPALSSRFFGLTVLDYRHYPTDLPYAITRTWDAYPGLSWPEMNPARGKYDFRGLDQYLSQVGTHGREIIYTFGRTPRWASTKPDTPGAYTPGECAAPDLAAWDDFVTAVVTHAAGRIRYWELWNEPDQPRFYCSDIPAMVTLAKHAKAIIKRLDPTALVLSPAAVGGDGAGWLANFIAAGGRDTFDVVAFHGYEGIHAEAILPIVAVYRHALSTFKMPDLPLIDTECSWGENPIGDDAQRAAFVAKYFILQWSTHVSRVLWYALDGDPKWGRLIDDRGALLPDGLAYAETYKWIVGATLTEPCAQDVQGNWICRLTRPGGYEAQIVWNSDLKSPRDFALPKQMTAYRDLAGKRTQVVDGKVPIGNGPVIIESKAATR